MNKIQRRLTEHALLLGILAVAVVLDALIIAGPAHTASYLYANVLRPMLAFWGAVIPTWAR